MELTKEQAYEKIARLVERFSEHVEEYKRHGYNEHQTRVDYINPFFKALGWDVDNEQGYAEAYREVIHEDKVKVGSSTKAPDYGFTLFGQRKFFVDAKKPAINIKGDIAPAYQVRRYGWSAKVPISIVTDFEEFSIYDCTKKPILTDKASVSRIKYITYDQYLDEFDFLWDVFAKENLPKGRFDKYVKSDTRKKGTATVDDEFLKSIEEWRKYLATNIAIRNKSLNEDEINYAVQKIIDRIIFLRMCEDRGVEQYGNLKNAAEKGDIYKNLFALYHMADKKYNSGLFDFKEDTITPTLMVDNKVMKKIINELYYPNCEYEFSVMPADILGSVYERFLGKTIRLTKAHHAKIEEKPEVRKAGGVYYTPKYIVDYIVENTVGKLIKGKKPKDIEKIKICDPACGSGSFLIGAYQFLLEWHLKYYAINPPKKKKDNPLTPDGNLTTAEKKQILLNNIFGVDIDTQAVEVTKLNLLLKALEGETQASINQQLQLFHERVLPNLSDNIKCGNSLIGTDFFDNQLGLYPEKMKKINAFDWEAGFPEIFKQGGFDAVIGNPPYVGRSTSFAETEKQYMKNKYQTAEGKYELYQFFLEKSTMLIKKKGAFISLITPQTWLSIIQATKLRKLILSNYALNKIIFLGKNVFKASVDTIIFIIESGRSKKQIEFYQSERLFDDRDTTPKRKINMSEIDKSTLIIPIILDDDADEVLNSIYEATVPLSEIGKWSDGVKVVGPAKAFAFQNKKYDKTFFQMYVGSDIKRYFSNWGGLYCCREKYAIEKHQATDIRLRNEAVFNKEKILIRKTGNRIVATIDYHKFYYEQSVFSFSLNNTEYDLKFVLGLLNSNLATYLLKNNPFSKKDTFPQIRLHWLKEFPIKENFDNGLSVKIIKLVDNVLKFNEQLQNTKLETQRQQIQRTITHTEKKIDELVYGLYKLSEEEIEIIEKI